MDIFAIIRKKQVSSALMGAIFLVCLSFIYTIQVLAAPVINISNLPSTVIAGESFNVTVSLSSLEVSTLYRVKSLGGAAGGDFQKVYTLGADGSSWLAWNGAWDSMPQVSSDASGSAQLTVSSKFYNDFSGDAVYKIRIRKASGGDYNDSSDEWSLQVTVQPSPSPSPSPDTQTSPSPSPNISPSPSPKVNPSPKASKKPNPSPSPEQTKEATFSGEVFGVQASSSPSPAPENKKDWKSFFSLSVIISLIGFMMIAMAGLYVLIPKIKNLRNLRRRKFIIHHSSR